MNFNHKDTKHYTEDTMDFATNMSPLCGFPLPIMPVYSG